jgi:predicted regulator of Ras-like GTPase activity (Roadblock/LC7/MglB family)
MDAEEALADLTEISSQIDAAVVFEEDGAVLASTSLAEERARALAATARQLFAAAAELGDGGRELTQLDVALRDGGIYAVRDAGRAVVATAAAGSPGGLVLYDLRTCLRSIEDAEPPAKATRPRRPARKKASADA